MNNYLKKIKSVLYLLLWLFLVLAGWFFWIFFLGLDIWSYALPFILGLGVGVLSGLTPARTFLVSFLGFFILGILYNSLFPHVIFGLTLFGILCGLFAVAGAILRRMILRKRIEEIYLTSWEWVLLIGGVSLLADYFTIIGTYQEFFVYHRFLTYLKSFIPVTAGLFISGLYTGVFNNVEYKAVMKSVIRVTLASHLVYLVYMGYLLFGEDITWRSFLFVPLMGLYLVLVLVGTKIGYRFRDRIKTNG